MRKLTAVLQFSLFAVAAALAAVPAVSAAAARAAPRLPVANAGFEQAGTAPMPAGWRVTASRPAAKAAVSRDTETRHTGTSSLAVESSAPASVTVVSEPLALKVGRIYRLRGWMRTHGARADPTSRYPTAVPACLSMASFPFTNHSPAVGADSDWTRVETTFVATKSEDRVRLHFGNNGTAVGKAWFDDVEVEEVQDISEFVALETVRWLGEGYRYDDRGWIFLHVEGKPYERGYQAGYLMADEIVAYLTKVATQEDAKDPAAGWTVMRLLADATMLRGYEEEYLTEMRGIADGAARAGAVSLTKKPLDLLDVVTLNSTVDLRQLPGAMQVTPHALTGRSFLAAEDELKIPDEAHKCSAFTANGPATADGKVVFGQIFMWSGYTGVHFNVIADVVPSEGQRLVFQTFPGGIHSGTDFYMNGAGIIIGETTVAQTPFNPTGTAQSNRIRKAAQYARSIDEVTRALRQRNNGLYTNDWMLADVKTNEVAIFLLGTQQSKLWRSGDDPSPFGTPGFFWSNNNARDPGVRREYAASADGTPYDVVFGPWNRDVAFFKSYPGVKGKLDSVTAAELLASSPINRPHACDGKITTTEMARELVLLAHHGKVTLREKFPEKGNRRMPDLPGAVPHLSLGYSVASPVFITEKLKEARARHAPPGKAAATKEPATPRRPEHDLSAVAATYKLAKKRLWRGTLLPAAEADNALSSGAAAYWSILNELPDEPEKAYRALGRQLGDLNSRLLYLSSREADLAPAAARRAYDRYGPYQIPRIKGTFLLHQLRLLLGDDLFLKAMHALHAEYAGKALTTRGFIASTSKTANRPLEAFVRQWLERTGLPDLRLAATTRQDGNTWKTRLEIAQSGPAYHLLTRVALETDAKIVLQPVELKGERTVVELETADRPRRVRLNPGHDAPVPNERFYVWPNLADDFAGTVIVYGTSRQIEANHTLALRWQERLADAVSEALLPVVPDAEVTDGLLANHDVVVLGAPEDNRLAARLARDGPAELGKNFFRWRGTTYARSDDGLLLVLPNPANRKRAVYWFIANSALELHEMTKTYNAGLSSWALFRGAEVKEQGHHEADPLVVEPGLPAAPPAIQP